MAAYQNRTVQATGLINVEVTLQDTCCHCNI